MRRELEASTGVVAKWCAALLLCASAHAAQEPFGFDSLRLLVESNGAQSVEALIAVLPAELRSHYTLVFDSRSLQSSSFENPRAVLYLADASLVVTFNGDPAQRGSSAVETMAFDSTTNSFQFREIRFDTTPTGASAVTYSETNPARCIACHGRPARPIWDTAPSWPGVYGERYHAGLSPAESQGIRRFLARQPEHPRYRYLIAAERFDARDTYVPSSRAAYNGAQTEPPNAELSALLSRLNVRSMIAEMAVTPGFDAHRYVLLAAVDGTCGPLAEFYPPAARAAFAEREARFVADATATDRRQSVAKVLRGVDSSRAPHAGVGSADHAELRFVAEQDLGVSTRDWTLALEKATFDFATPTGADGLAEALFEWVAQSDPEMRPLAAFRALSADDRYCKYLRDHSVNALTTWDRSRLPAVNAGASPVSSPDPRAMLERCISCHTGRVATPLPFADDRALAHALAGGNYRRGRLLDEILYRLTPEAGLERMPRGLTLTDQEQRAMENYFLALAGPSSVVGP